MHTALVIPSLGGPTLEGCLGAVLALRPAAERLVLVLSGTVTPAPIPPEVVTVSSRRRLGFAEAVNAGLEAAGEVDAVALLNDDAEPETGWLGALMRTLADDPGCAGVQGTVVDGLGTTVDGRGIALDRWLLPVQVDRGRPTTPEPPAPLPRLAVSATAALYRRSALAAAALPGGSVLDPRFGSYHEDLDLGLRLARLGFSACWTPAARCRHLGSASATRLRWRHPWWLLANRWRMLAGNLTPAATLRLLPAALRGELRAVHTLARRNPRALVVAPLVTVALPGLLSLGWRRPSPGPRLDTLERSP